QENTITQLNQDKTDLETAKNALETAKNKIISDREQTIRDKEQTIKTQENTITQLNQDKTDLETAKNALETAKNKIISDREQTIVTLTENEEINFEQKKYLYNKINKIPKQKKLMFSNKFISLIKQYLKNFSLINNKTWKLLCKIYFIIILCVINILFYSLLIERFKSH
ncbi:hypothetical protein, partial [Candidatus Phytoplasma fabacearum]